jgi:hypothetical protein
MPMVRAKYSTPLELPPAQVEALNAVAVQLHFGTHGLSKNIPDTDTPLLALRGKVMQLRLLLMMACVLIVAMLC